MFRRIFSHLTRNNRSSYSAYSSPDFRAAGSYDNGLLLIDTSGSMSDTDWKPSRLGGAIESAVAYVKQLAKNDSNACVAVIRYATSAEVVVPLTRCRYSEQIKNQIRRIQTGSSTNITSALMAAYDICSKSSGINQVILLSDGFHNVGPDPRGISDRLKKYATIECVGIGGSPMSVDEQLMLHIASARPDGSKRYRWIGKKEVLVQHFRELAGGLTRA